MLYPQPAHVVSYVTCFETNNSPSRISMQVDIKSNAPACWLAALAAIEMAFEEVEPSDSLIDTW